MSNSHVDHQANSRPWYPLLINQLFNYGDRLWHFNLILYKRLGRQNDPT